jgi:putative endonuclease
LKCSPVWPPPAASAAKTSSNWLPTLSVSTQPDATLNRYGEIAGFTRDYHCVFLVHCEHCRDIRVAIAREKQLKGWRREKKNALIAETNPRWDDLAAEWL